METPHSRPYLEGIRQALADNAAGVRAKAEAEQHRIASGVKGPSNFTTKYAIAWGRSQGWKLLARERYDHLNRRHQDLMLGMDVLMDAPLPTEIAIPGAGCPFQAPAGLNAIQGAGRGERARHRRRFEQDGGVEKAHRLHVAVWYLEFVRGHPDDPCVVERWA